MQGRGGLPAYLPCRSANYKDGSPASSLARGEDKLAPASITLACRLPRSQSHTEVDRGRQVLAPKDSSDVRSSVRKGPTWAVPFLRSGPLVGTSEGSWIGSKGPGPPKLQAGGLPSHVAPVESQPVTSRKWEARAPLSLAGLYPMSPQTGHSCWGTMLTTAVRLNPIEPHGHFGL